MNTWRDIPGWCDFEDLYASRVDAASNGAHFVEIGTWVGKSTCLMAELIRQSGKEIHFDAIEHGKGSPELGAGLLAIQERGSDVFSELTKNITACGLVDYVRPICADSVQAALFYADHSLDFVFIDGDHTETAVDADIEAWLPRVKFGGVLAGHDFDLQSVRRSVYKHFAPISVGRCWVHAKED